MKDCYGIRDRAVLIEQMEYKKGAKKKNVVHIEFSQGCLFTEMNSQYMATSSRHALCNVPLNSVLLSSCGVLICCCMLLERTIGNRVSCLLTTVTFESRAFS